MISLSETNKGNIMLESTLNQQRNEALRLSCKVEENTLKKQWMAYLANILQRTVKTFILTNRFNLTQTILPRINYCQSTFKQEK